MPRPITISSGQWWDVPFETLCSKMADFGYDGIELACWGDHFDVDRALGDDSYVGRHLEFGEPRRYWDFRSPGRGRIDLEAIIRALNEVCYTGPLSVEFEDPDMDREYGVREACEYVRRLDFIPAKQFSN